MYEETKKERKGDRNKLRSDGAFQIQRAKGTYSTNYT